LRPYNNPKPETQIKEEFMKYRTSLFSTMTALLTGLLLASGSLCLAARPGDAKPKQPGKDAVSTASPAKPASAELAKKREMVRKQQEQRITQEQRKAGAKALQAERKKVYDAKQYVKNSQQPGSGNKP
jgi:hypothetical protein